MPLVSFEKTPLLRIMINPGSGEDMSSAPPANHPSQVKRWIGGIVLAAGIASVVAFYFWTAAPAVSQHGPATPADAYYSLLVQGFRSGHLSMNLKPAPELAKLSNPYDPALNGRYRVHDVSYYRGQLYLYFGVTPALVLYWPYVLLTGHYLFHKDAVAIFCAAGFLVAALLVGRVRRRHFPEAGMGATLAGLLAMGLATALPVLLRRPDVWEVPISCAFACVMAALLGLWHALQLRKGAVLWMAAASTAYGLALGARPSLMFGAAILLAPPLRAAACDAERMSGGRPRFWRLLAAAVLPVGACGAGLLLYNYLRFDNPLEFGQRYQMTWSLEHGLRHFGPDFLWSNLRMYLFQPVWWGTYFPFVKEIMPPKLPAGQIGVENPFGILANVPFVWLALAAPLAWRGRSAEERSILQWFLLPVAFLAAASLLTICLFAGTCGRYEVDFLPAFVLLAVCGVFGVERVLAGRPGLKRLCRAGWIGLLAFSILFNLLISMRAGGRFRTEAPDQYRAVARTANWPVHWLERQFRVRHGPLELRVLLPPFTGGRYEPLLVTGFGPEADYFYLTYEDSAHIRIALEHTTYGGPSSEALSIDYEKEHTFVIDFGSLYPPPEHPYYPAKPSAVAAARQSRLRVLLDGREVLSGLSPAYDASPWSRYLGYSPFSANMGRQFTGKILSRRTLEPPELPELDRVGPATLRVRFRRMLPGIGEPLIVTGVSSRADMLYARYPDNGHIVLGLDHWGGGGPQSAPIAIEPGRTYAVTALMGSLFPPSAHLAPDDPRRRWFEVRFEGKTVLTGDIDFFPAEAGQVYFGWNPLGGSTTSKMFAGEILQIDRGG